jgi:signal transduction histidine kinase
MANEPQPTPQAPNGSYEEQLKAANEVVYKHGLELAERNKVLLLLDKLYDISIKALTPKDVAGQIATTVRETFDFERVGIRSYDKTRDDLKSLAFAESERFRDAHASVQAFSDGITVTGVSTHRFFEPVLKALTAGYTENLRDAYEESVPPEVLAKLREEGHVRSLLVYPLIIENEAIGIVMIYVNRPFEDLTDFEKSSLKNLGNVIAVALDKAILYDELNETNRRQENLLHFVGHEVKGFLTKDQGALASLKEGDFGALSDAAQEFVSAALTQTREGVRSVTDLLQASNQKKGTVSYKKEPFDLKLLTAEITEFLRSHAKNKGLELFFKADNRSSYATRGDRDQFGDHVIRNLIDNAINYTPTGSVTVSLVREGEKFIFSVKDTGKGITDEDKARLFTEGGRGKDSLRYNAHSTGYGLFISKNIVEAHGGTIRAESEGEGKGSSFIVELPITP